jgi:cytoskeletal protein CcmA (bactofilin family)
VNQDQAETTVIARNTFFKGELHLSGPAVIAGRVEGVILSEDSVEIAVEGHLEGDIEGALIDIHGTVKGNVVATRACRLGNSARVTGELRAANLAIAEGACFIGQVCVGGAREKPIAPAADEEEELAQSGAINRIEAMAQEVDSLADTAAGAGNAGALAPTIAAPVPVSVVGGGPAPTVRVVNQSVQNLQRAPRIIKAR